jgi:hypothetical protein
VISRIQQSFPKRKLAELVEFTLEPKKKFQNFPNYFLSKKTTKLFSQLQGNTAQLVEEPSITPKKSTWTFANVQHTK